MIEDYFGLIRAPFKLSADPYFYFDSATHRKALSYLEYGIQQAEGFVVITGDTGVGKTTLVDHLLDSIDDSQVLAAKMDISHIDRGEALHNVLSAFRIDPQGDYVSGSEALEDYLNDQYDAGRQAILIIDEAQNLAPWTLEELRVLTNISRDGLPLLQIFLIGQTEIKRLVAREDMEQFRQRIIASYHVMPLTREETAAYIDHRLYTAGFEDEQSLFTDRAQDLIFEETGGVPRMINKLCSRALLQTALEEKDYVDAATVQQVIDDFAAETQQIMADDEENGTAKTNVVPFAGSGEAAASQPAGADELGDFETDDFETGEFDQETEELWQNQAINAEPHYQPSAYQQASFQQPYGTSRGAASVSLRGGMGQPVQEPVAGVEDVLDRLERDESGVPAGNDGVAGEGTADGESFSEIGRQLNEDMGAAPVGDQPAAMQENVQPTMDKPEMDQPAPPPFVASEQDQSLPDFSDMPEDLPGSRVNAFKSELDNFVSDVREGLQDVENSMRTVTERVAEIESYRESRSRLLHDRLQEIEILLTRLQGRN